MGYSLILHGGMTLDGINSDNTSTWFYHLEIYVGFALAWPVTIYGWLKSALTNNNVLGAEVVFIQLGGYAALYFLHSKWGKNKT